MHLVDLAVCLCLPLLLPHLLILSHVVLLVLLVLIHRVPPCLPLLSANLWIGRATGRTRGHCHQKHKKSFYTVSFSRKEAPGWMTEVTSETEMYHSLLLPRFLLPFLSLLLRQLHGLFRRKDSVRHTFSAEVAVFLGRVDE